QFHCTKELVACRLRVTVVTVDSAIVLVHAAQVCAVGLRIVRQDGVGYFWLSGLLRVLYYGRERRGNFACNGSLDVEHVVELTLVYLGPEHHAIPGADQMNFNPDAIGFLANASLEDGFDAQLLTDRFRIVALALERER